MELSIIELTEENQEKYLDQVASLEIKVLENMEKNGKTGQLFITGKEDILEYIKSKENMVICSVNEMDEVNSAVYITQGQYPFTYNDITKYFKNSQGYKEYVKKIYGKNYKMKMLETYEIKLRAFEYAKNMILREYPEYFSITNFLETELNSENKFDEKSVLREKINKYMSIFMQQKNKMAEYEHFYWVTSKEIFQELRKSYIKDKLYNKTIFEYDNFLENAQLEIHKSNVENESLYYDANTSNSIEIDTYITDPNSRHAGLARILVYEGLKQKIIENFKDTNNKEIYLCSTLHQENLSSKYVSEFFGLTDNMFVKRRANRDREVHIYKVERDNYVQYLNEIQDKLIVLYNYNPTKKTLTTARKIEILKKQYNYERAQYLRLVKIRNNKKDFKGSLKDIMPKLEKMGKIKQTIKELISRGNDNEQR